MNKPKFTPGPWQSNRAPMSAIGYERVVETVGNRFGPSIADVVLAPDAALIAAAPELYQALERVTDILEHSLMPFMATGSSQFEHASERVNKARAALARARGE